MGFCGSKRADLIPKHSTDFKTDRDALSHLKAGDLNDSTDQPALGERHHILLRQHPNVYSIQCNLQLRGRSDVRLTRFSHSDGPHFFGF